MSGGAISSGRSRAGFVLAGGRSSGMGRDKALLTAIAAAVFEAAGNLTIVGSPQRRGFLGDPVDEDAVPGITAAFLSGLFEAAEGSGKNCLAPSTAQGLEPLCAVYHARILSQVESAVRNKSLKMPDFVRTLETLEWPAAAAPLRNVNTPEEWEAR